MSYTKRSPVFQDRMNYWVNAVREMKWPESVKAELIDIFLNYTTDSPCVVKAKDNEPVFVLRGQDVTAPELVDTWAQQFFDAHSEPLDDSMVGRITNPNLAEHYEHARACAEAMRHYPNRKFPD